MNTKNNESGRRLIHAGFCTSCFEPCSRFAKDNPPQDVILFAPLVNKFLRKNI